MKALIPDKTGLKTAFQTFFLFSAFAKWEKNFSSCSVSKWNFSICQTLTKLFRTLFLKCRTESKADCLNKRNIDMLSKATTSRRTWKFILRARKKKSFSYPGLSGSRQYHDRQSVRMILRGYRVWHIFAWCGSNKVGVSPTNEPPRDKTNKVSVRPAKT